MPTYVSTAMQLINAISAANGDLDNVHEIELEADIGLSSEVGNLFGPVGTPVVRGQVVINGAGYKIERTSGTIRLFSVNAKNGAPNASLTLRNLHLRNGDAGGSAGSGLAVNDGFLSLENCTVSNCRGATNGGAIYNGDGCNMLVNNCAFIDNYAIGSNGRGGAIYNSSGSSLEIKDTVFAGNNALGAGSLGGAIYRHSGGSVLIINSAFCGNEAPNASHIYNNSSAFDATQSWWGAVGGPPGGTIGGPVNYEPYRTTLPRFVPTPGITENPCLPSIVGNCKIRIKSGQFANVFWGPSDDDYSRGTPTQLQQNEEVPLRAIATDETTVEWYAFEDTVHRPFYLSWVKKNDTQLEIIGDNCDAPDFSTIGDDDYGCYIASGQEFFTALPLRSLANRSMLGFGLFGTQWSATGNRHNGFDFFPSSPVNAEVLSAQAGIVVGIGPAGESSNPTTWGADGDGASGFNLVIRTKGYFVIYGHLASIDPSLYYGARVFPDDLLAVLIQQTVGMTDNTHLHLEVRIFTTDVMENIEPLRCHFGAIVRHRANAQPPFTLDPMNFVAPANRGTCISGPCGSSGTGDNTYNDAELSDQSFDYTVANDYELQKFSVLTSFTPSPIDDGSECECILPEYCE